MEIEVNDWIAYTYRGELELAQVVALTASGCATIRLSGHSGLDDSLAVKRVVWKGDAPHFRANTTLGKIRSKLR